MNSIKNYLTSSDKRRSKKLLISDITVPFLKGYEKWMLGNDRSPNTVGIYLRPLKALYNKAILDNPIDPSLNPFGKGKYVIPKTTKVKKALNAEELNKLYSADLPVGSYQRKARDFWFFSYQNSGMNITDILRLKYGNITNDSISFYRTKTRGATKADMKPIILSNTDLNKEMIKLYGNSDTSKENYVFPILNHSMTPEQLTSTNKQLAVAIAKLKPQVDNTPLVSTSSKLVSITNETKATGRFHSDSFIALTAHYNSHVINYLVGMFETLQNTIAAISISEVAEPVVNGQKGNIPLRAFALYYFYKGEPITKDN